MSIEGNATLSVQIGELSEVAEEVAELRWDVATESIRGEGPERATMNQ